MTPILETKELCKFYGSGDSLVKAVDHVNIQISRGEFVAIVGKSGSGKSTLLHLLGGLEYPTSGDVIVDGEHIAGLSEAELALLRRRKTGVIFQAYNAHHGDARKPVRLSLLYMGKESSHFRRVGIPLSPP